MAPGEYSLLILPSARREMAKLSRSIQQRVRPAIDSLAREPRPAGAVLLSTNVDDRIWRIRVGDYRVLYQVKDDRMVVLVVRVAHRREAYRPRPGG